MEEKNDLVAPVDVVPDSDRIVAIHQNGDELIGVAISERPKQHGIDDAEDGGVRANSESKNGNGDNCETRSMHHGAEAVLHILRKQFRGRLHRLRRDTDLWSSPCPEFQARPA